MSKDKKLYIVVPCYNEEAVLAETCKRLAAEIKRLEKTDAIGPMSRVIFVDDGSQDKTWELIEKFSKDSPSVVGVKLSRNRGHQNALLAGLEYARDRADIVVSIDADLQDDIAAIGKMIAEYDKGNDIVYGVRSSRKKDTFFKRNTALAFYKLMKWLGVDIIHNHADYRLMSRKALVELDKFGEVNLFLRGIVPLIGFKSSTVTYERAERFAGESKYPLRKMLHFALDGITSFSVKPLKLISSLGVLFLVFSVAMMAYSLASKATGQTVSGWTFIACSIWLIAGVQMLSLGIVGEYIGKIYSEVKRRPRFIVERVVE